MANIALPYPWQQEQWQQLVSKDTADHLPHALLFAGQEGVGKNRMAVAFGNYLLCDFQDKHLQMRACGECKGCQLNSAGTHPDLTIIEPDEPGKAIKIDQIRALVEFIQKTAQYSGYRVVIIRPAEALNIAAANALLKSLEEPGTKTVLLLVTHSASSLLPTIKSRCQAISCHVPPLDAVLPWLTQQVDSESLALSLLGAANGCPLKAMVFHNSDWFGKRAETLAELLAIRGGTIDPLKIAKKWLDYPFLELMDWLLIWGTDLLKIQGGVSERVNNRDLLSFLTPLSAQIKSNSVMMFSDSVQTAKRQALSSANPNKQLLLEDLLLRWQKA